MPRVLRIINRLNLGGPTYNAAFLSRYLAPEFETLLLAGQKEESEASSEFILDQIGVKATTLPSMRRSIGLLSDIRTFFAIVRVIRKFKPDIVHTHAAKAGILGRIAAWYCRVPVIVHTFHGHVFHSYFSTSVSKIIIVVERLLAKISTKIITISPSQNAEIVERFHICKAEKSCIVPLGLQLERFWSDQEEKRDAFRAEYQVDADTIAIGIIGRLVPIKNHELFIDAFKEVLQHSRKAIEAFVIGDGELKDQLIAYCKEIGVPVLNKHKKPGQRGIYFTSWIQDVEKAINGLDIIALSSINEGTPVSLIEAMAAAKMVVSTNVGGVEDIVSHGNTGRLCAQNSYELSKELLYAIDHPKESSKMALAGQEFVRKNYHYEALVQNMRLLYNNLLANL